MAPSSTSIATRALGLGLPLLLGVVVAAGWIAVSGIEALSADLARIRPLGVAVVLSLTAIWLFLRFLRWQYLLRRAGVRIPIRASGSIYLAGLVGTATPAYLGEVVRPVLIRRRFSVPLRRTVPVWIVERAMDVGILLVVLLLTTTDPRVHLISGVGLAVALVALAGGVLWGGKRRWAGAWGVVKPGPLGVALGASAALWLVAGALPAAAAMTLGASLPPTSSEAVFAGATLGGALSLMPAGMGSVGSLAILSLQERGFELHLAVAVVSVMRVGSAGVALAVGVAALVRELARSQPDTTDAAAHFDDIAADYHGEWTEHVWRHLMGRKMGMLYEALGSADSAGRGLDLGCGLGRQARHARNRGYGVVGVDPSFGLLRGARGADVPVGAARGEALPFPDESFDWVYTVGVLHHVPGPGGQEAVMREVRRVLRPGGAFLIHETNPRNPLFRFYMGYVFPLLKEIDEGIEQWIPPARLEELEGFEVARVRYFTFIPDFVPAILLGPALTIQRWLESSPVRSWSVHYLAELRRVPDSPTSASEARPHVRTA